MDIGAPNAGTAFPHPWQRNTIPLQSQVIPTWVFQGTWSLERGFQGAAPLGNKYFLAGTPFPHPWQMNTVPLQSRFIPTWVFKGRGPLNGDIKWRRPLKISTFSRERRSRTLGKGTQSLCNPISIPTRVFQGTLSLERGCPRGGAPWIKGTSYAGTPFPHPWQRNTVPLQSPIKPLPRAGHFL